MINFLPPQQKEALLAEEKLKLILILGIIVFALIVSVFLNIISTKIFLSSQLEIQKIFLAEREREFESFNVKEAEKEIRETNAIFSGMRAFYLKQAGLIGVLEKVASLLPGEVYLTDFNFSDQKISLAGFSPDRDKLMAFKENLEKEKDFKNVYFPPSNWLEKNNINFIVSLSYEL